MKKATVLLALILISTIGFSQNKIGGNDPIPGIDIIIKKNPGSKPIVNTENNPLITQANDLKEIYLEKLTKDWFKNKSTLAKEDKVSGRRIYFGEYLENRINDTNYEFYRIEGHLGKNNKDIFTAYIAFLKKKITEGKPRVVKANTVRSKKSATAVKNKKI